MSDAWCECCGWRGAHDAHNPECGLFQAHAEIARLTAELSRAQDHARAGADALRSCGAQTQEIGGRLDAAGEEIARLTAELTAARAVPGDVEAAIDAIECRGCGHGDPVTNADADRLRTAIARAISDATAARGTVGGLLATAPVGAIVEFWHGATANQITTRVGGIDDRAWLWRYRNPNGEWSPWDYEAPSPDDLSQPGEIVPSDPSQRAPLLAAAPNLHPDGCHTADPTAPRDCTSDGHHECTSCARFDAAGRAAMGDDPIGGLCGECGGEGVILGGDDGQGHQEEWPCRSCTRGPLPKGG